MPEASGAKEDCMRDELTSDRIVFGVAISTPSGEKMDDPSEKADSSNPRNACQNEPKYADKYSTVINLSDTGN